MKEAISRSRSQVDPSFCSIDDFIATEYAIRFILLTFNYCGHFSILYLYRFER